MDDNYCSFNITTIISMTNIHPTDIIYTSFTNRVRPSVFIIALYYIIHQIILYIVFECIFNVNDIPAILHPITTYYTLLRPITPYYEQVYEIPFFVCLDHRTKSILISIRGTLSLRVSTSDHTPLTYTKSDFIFQIILLHTRSYRYDSHDTILLNHIVFGSLLVMRWRF